MRVAHLLRMLGGLGLVLTVAGACDRKPPTTVPRAAPVSPGTNSVPLTSVSVPSSSPSPASVPSFEGAGIIRCGPHVCQVGEERCCWFEHAAGDSFCTADLPLPIYEEQPDSICWPDELSGVDAGKRAPQGGIGNARVMFCDDATDCADGQRCFGAWNQVDGDDHWDVQKCAPPTIGISGDYEACVEGSPCPAGTGCVRNRCNPSTEKQRLECGTAQCQPGQICCVPHESGPEPSCAAPDHCAGRPYSCTSSRNCPGAQTCFYSDQGSQCLGQRRHFDSGALCETAVDCPPTVFFGTGAAELPEQTACVPVEQHPWMKQCVPQE